MRSRLAVTLVLVAPTLAGCALLGPGSHYDVTIATEAVGEVLSEGTPASHARIFLALTDADTDRPVPPNRTHEAGPGEPGAELTVPPNRSKAIWRLPLDARGEVTVRIPVDGPVVATFRIVESEPPFHVSGDECPEPQRLRSLLSEEPVGKDETWELSYFVRCGSES